MAKVIDVGKIQAISEFFLMFDFNSIWIRKDNLGLFQATMTTKY